MRAASQSVITGNSRGMWSAGVWPLSVLPDTEPTSIAAIPEWHTYPTPDTDLHRRSAMLKSMVTARWCASLIVFSC